MRKSVFEAKFSIVEPEFANERDPREYRGQQFDPNKSPVWRVFEVLLIERTRGMVDQVALPDDG